MNNKILILEDDGGGDPRTAAFLQNIPKEYSVTVVTTATDAIWALSQDNFYAIFLDHDVPDTHKQNGLEVAHFIAIRSLVSPGIPRPKIIIHSRNHYGAAAMKQLLPDAICWPGVWSFPEEILKILKD